MPEPKIVFVKSPEDRKQSEGGGQGTGEISGAAPVPAPAPVESQRAAVEGLIEVKRVRRSRKKADGLASKAARAVKATKAARSGNEKIKELKGGNTSRLTYSEEFVANALEKLKENGGNVKRTAIEVGVYPITLWRWAEDAGVKRSAVEAQKEHTRKMAFKKVQLADAFERIALKFLKAVTPDKIRITSALELTRAAAICAEKMQLLKGQATSITGNVPMGELSDEELERRRQVLKETLEKVIASNPKAAAVVQQLVHVQQQEREDLTP